MSMHKGMVASHAKPPVRLAERDNEKRRKADVNKL